MLFIQALSRAVLLISCSLALAACGGSDSGIQSCPSGQTYSTQTKSCVERANRAPVITSANSFSLQDNVATGTVVYTATATDADGDTISWALADSKAIFSINSSGAIQVASSANLISAAGSSYSITLTAQDSKQASSQLSITVSIAQTSSGNTPVVTPAEGQAVIYYYRADANYDGWVLHAWNNSSCNAYADFADDGGTDWNTGFPLSGVDEHFGAYWLFELKDAASCANFIVHKGDSKDPDDNDQTLQFATAHWAFVVSGVGIFTSPDDIIFEAPFRISDAAAHWIDRETLVWNQDAADARLLFSATAGLDTNLSSAGSIALSQTSLSTAQQARVPHLASWQAYRFEPSDQQLQQLIKSQLVLASFDAEQQPVTASYVQQAKLLDALFTGGAALADEQPLGISYQADGIDVAVWAPTAQQLRLKVYHADKSANASYDMQYDTSTGIWHYTAPASADRLFYRFEVTVYHPATRRIEVTEATDPYAVNSSSNGRYAQFVNLDDADLKPAGWDSRPVPQLPQVEDAIILEAHIRDFSIFDSTTTEANRGKYLAFTEPASDAVQYLQRLKNAGLTHLHLLPFNDIASIEEDAAQRIELSSTVAQLCQRNAAAAVCGSESGSATLLSVLQSFDPASTAAAQLIEDMRGLDGFNWGYDPHHFNVVEGSYASTAEGTARIVEFRQMVLALQQLGLRVAADVVYNHTASSGLFDNSVLDKLVPGYYHRYSEVSGNMERSTCCENTASEHRMMAKLVVDSLLHWHQALGVNDFRFDIMGHMPAALLEQGRAAVAQISPDTYFYGEGWNFGEVANNRLFEQATQYNLAGSKIGTFNDRPRDTIREAALSMATVNLSSADHIRLGLAGTLQDYVLRDKDGERRPGLTFSQSSYAKTPADAINYVDKHDNETLWDKLQYALPADMSADQRVRVHNLSAAIPLLSQGIPFFQLGIDKLRSKSLDSNSYDSGDWFNRIDYSNNSNNWNAGLPRLQDNPDQNRIAQLSANPNIVVNQTLINRAEAVFAEFLQIRSQSPLLRLNNSDDVSRRLGFHNTGPAQLPGVIVMSLDDGTGLTDLDPQLDAMVVVINGSAQSVSPAVRTATGFSLHPVQQTSADAQVQQASFQPAAGEGVFTVPAYTVAVFIKPQAGAQGPGLAADPDYVPSPYGDAILFADGFGDGAAEMSYDGEGNYSVTATLAATEYQFELTDFAGISLGFADLSAAAETLAFSPGANGTIAFSPATAGSYQLVLNITQPTPSLRISLLNSLVNCAMANASEPPPFVIAGSGSLFVRGSHSGWDAQPAYKLSYKGNNQYQAVAEFSGDFEFKLASDDGSWTTQLWAQQPSGQIDTSNLTVGVAHAVAYNNAGTDNNRTSLAQGTYSFLLTLDSANPAQGDNVGSLLIEQCQAD